MLAAPDERRRGGIPDPAMREIDGKKIGRTG